MLVKRAHQSHDFELNLTPIIDCFVTLICFMLLSTTYVSLIGMDAKVPIAVLASSAQAQKEPAFKLEMTVTSSGTELAVHGAGSANGKRKIPHVSGKPDLAKLHAELVRVKHERPKEFSIHFSSEIDMTYEDLVRVMDATRNLDTKDGSFTITDERNGKPVKIDILFPDFIMAGMAATGK